jgi:hypothetical protein
MGISLRNDLSGFLHLSLSLIAPRHRPSSAPVNASERATIRGAAVTTEDSGRLSAFATEPRMAMLRFIALLITDFVRGG